MLTDELLKRINDIITKTQPQKDTSKTVTLTGSALTLPNESCKYVTFLNLTGENVILTINGGGNFTLPTNVGITVFVTNTNQITANGTNLDTLQYIISE